ncbi:unnamed protein product [Penicillium palitans]
MITRVPEAPRYPQLNLPLYQDSGSLLAGTTQQEEDLKQDPMGSILMQPDAAERIEVELFTRLEGLVA